MKKILSLKYICIAVFTMLFIACDNEPLEGEFPTQTDPNTTIQPGNFIATVNQESFTAIASSATLNADGVLVITGSSQGSGNLLTLTVENGAAAAYDLNPGNNSIDAGVYINLAQANNPYASNFDTTTNGELIVSTLDMTGLTVSGIFNFVAKRVRLDASGNPLLDSNGNQIIEEVTVENGQFSEIPLTITTGGGTDDTTDDGMGGEEEENRDNIFEAIVDGINFDATMVLSELATVTDKNIVRIMGINANGESIRLDIPEDLGLGTFTLGDADGISDGTQLFGLYNNGNGAPNLTSNPGSITITDFSTQTGRIIGTFNFMGSDPLMTVGDTVSVTNGSFTIFYEPDVNNAQESFTCLVDEVTYNPTEIANFTSLFGPNEIELVTIRTNDGTQEIRLTFPKDATTGTFPMSPETINGTEFVATYTPDINSTDPIIEYTSSTGSVTINSYNQNTGAIEGIYSFTATDPDMGDPTTYQITEGSFALFID